MRVFGTGRRVARAKMQVSQSRSSEDGSRSIPVTAPLSTNLRALATAMCPKRRCSSITDRSSAAFADSDVCLTLYRRRGEGSGPLAPLLETQYQGGPTLYWHDSPPGQALLGT